MTSAKKNSIVSIDIGSTWTKGARFEFDGYGALRFAGQTRRPTSVSDLAAAFGKVHAALGGGDGETVFSSSARGGLAIAALGLVPELTLKVAKTAALSAGGKITGVYAYRLNADDLAALDSPKIDIILFSGGTDGGNESIVLHNAELLRGLRSDATIIYAGNRRLAPRVAELLRDRPLVVTENLLPELDAPRTEDVNRAIRRIFFEKIVRGKGLDRIEEACRTRALPTPAALFEFCRLLSERDGQSFGLLDLGGATTDFYSCCEAVDPDAGVVFKGVPEPFAARTVEGDLGLRVSAGTVFDRVEDEPFRRYIEKVSTAPGHLAATPEEAEFDRRLAEKCCVEAILRHAGGLRTFYAASGRIEVQHGRDLRKLRTIIATGGYFTGDGEVELARAVSFAAARHPEKLLPCHARFFPDRSYLMIHLANLARLHPEPAADFARDYLRKIVTYESAEWCV